MRSLFTACSMRSLICQRTLRSHLSMVIRMIIVVDISWSIVKIDTPVMYMILQFICKSRFIGVNIRNISLKIISTQKTNEMPNFCPLCVAEVYALRRDAMREGTSHYPLHHPTTTYWLCCKDMQFFLICKIHTKQLVHYGYSIFPWW